MQHLINSDWNVISSALNKRSGADISSSPATGDGWLKVDIPCTALGALVRYGIYPDPRKGLNLFAIPDASISFNRQHGLRDRSYLPGGRPPWMDPYWFVNTFELAALEPDQRALLGFNCINYRAEVWLNGKQIAGPDTMCGMFQRFTFDVTHAVRRGENTLAVAVHCVDHPGLPNVTLEPFGEHRSFYWQDILNDVTEVMTVGYDCFPHVPDRNMGILQDVTVTVTGPVRIAHPFVRSRLPEGANGPAHLSVSTELINQTDNAVNGNLRACIRETGGTVTAPVALNPGEIRDVSFHAPESPELIVKDPDLWWPRKYGDQPLYNLKLEFETDNVLSDTRDVSFGIRTIEKELHQRGEFHGLRFILNGEKITLRGGYIQPELMLEWDAARMDAEVRLLAEANQDFVCFEDIPNPPRAFMDACDRHGVMMWIDFFCCSWSDVNRLQPTDQDVLEACTIDLIKRYRNHPCLTLYMCMNEGFPHKDIYTMWRRYINELDGTRLFIPSGYFPDDPSDPAEGEVMAQAPGYMKPREAPEWIARDLPTGVNDWAPKTYKWLQPAEYYRWVREYGNWMFMLEGASASVPRIESLREFLPNLDNELIGDRIPLNPTWAHHGANQYFQPFDEALRRRHGRVRDAADYCRKADLVSVEQHRAMYEAVNHRLWEITSGFGYWKMNACWPSVQWQFYDYYLRPTASYYAVKRACSPIHIQLSYLDRTVSVINASLHALKNCRAEVTAYSRDMKELFRKEHRVSMPANTYKDLLTVPEPDDTGPVWFVALKLSDESGNHLSGDVYWLLRPGLTDDRDCFDSLNRIPQPSLKTQAVSADNGITVQVQNTGDSIALLACFQLMDPSTGREVIPSFWSDNFISLLPGEERQLSVEH